MGGCGMLCLSISKPLTGGKWRIRPPMDPCARSTVATQMTSQQVSPLFFDGEPLFIGCSTRAFHRDVFAFVNGLWNENITHWYTTHWSWLVVMYQIHSSVGLLTNLTTSSHYIMNLTAHHGWPSAPWLISASSPSLIFSFAFSKSTSCGRSNPGGRGNWKSMASQPLSQHLWGPNQTTRTSSMWIHVCFLIGAKILVSCIMFGPLFCARSLRCFCIDLFLHQFRDQPDFCSCLLLSSVSDPAHVKLSEIRNKKH